MKKNSEVVLRIGITRHGVSQTDVNKLSDAGFKTVRAPPTLACPHFALYPRSCCLSPALRCPGRRCGATGATHAPEKLPPMPARAAAGDSACRSRASQCSAPLLAGVLAQHTLCWVLNYLFARRQMPSWQKSSRRAARRRYGSGERACLTCSFAVTQAGERSTRRKEYPRRIFLPYRTAHELRRVLGYLAHKKQCFLFLKHPPQ